MQESSKFGLFQGNYLVTLRPYKFLSYKCVRYKNTFTFKGV